MYLRIVCTKETYDVKWTGNRLDELLVELNDTELQFYRFWMEQYGQLDRPIVINKNEILAIQELKDSQVLSPNAVREHLGMPKAETNSGVNMTVDFPETVQYGEILQTLDVVLQQMHHNHTFHHQTIELQPWVLQALLVEARRKKA